MVQPLVAPGTFLDWFDARVGADGLPEPARGGRGRPRRVTTRQLLATLVFQVLYGVGTVRHHMRLLCQVPWADSSAAERRARLPWATFTALLTRVLQPVATPAEPDAFWQGLRVLAIDGTQFSVANTPQIAPRVRKAQTSQGPAAFAKLTTVVLLEVGHHNPVAAAIGAAGESEWALAQTLLPQVPPRVSSSGTGSTGSRRLSPRSRPAAPRPGVTFCCARGARRGRSTGSASRTARA